MLRHLLLSVILLGTFWGKAQPLALYTDNPRYFAYKDQPIVLVGSGEHYGAVLNPDFDYKTYFVTLKKAGINYTRIFTGQYAESYDPGTFGIPKNTLGPAKGRLRTPYPRSNEDGYIFGGNKFDLSRWDEQYWKRLKDVVATAQTNGVIVEITLFTSLYTDDGWRSSPLCAEANLGQTEEVVKNEAFTLKNKRIVAYQSLFVKRMARELNEFDNVLYEIQNEPWADGGVRGEEVKQRDTIAPAHAEAWQKNVEYANPDRMAWQMHMAQVLHDAESALPKKHLIARNHANFRGKIGQKDQHASVYHFHYAHPNAVTDNWHLGQPICCDETGFNGTGDDPYRRQAWRFFLAGGAMFNHLDYSFTVEHPDGTDQQDAPGGGSPKLRQQLAYLKETLTNERIWEMAPMPDIVQKLENAHAWAMGTKDKKRIIVFVEGFTSAQWLLHLKLPAQRYTLQFLDPMESTSLMTLVQKTKNGEIAVAGTPAMKESVIIIRAGK
jgi:hypothetical protein